MRRNLSPLNPIELGKKKPVSGRKNRPLSARVISSSNHEIPERAFLPKQAAQVDPNL
jgi:hypothetical protein